MVRALARAPHHLKCTAVRRACVCVRRCLVGSAEPPREAPVPRLTPPRPAASAATIQEDKGRLYLCTKSIERAHLPSRLWDRVRLSRNYAKALEQVSDALEFWPKYLVHKNKQRLTKMTQMLIRMRKLALRAMPKLVPVSASREAKERRKEAKALQAAKVDKAIENELLQRLQQGTYGEIYNFPMQQFGKVLDREKVADKDADDLARRIAEEEEDAQAELDAEEAEAGEGGEAGGSGNGGADFFEEAYSDEEDEEDDLDLNFGGADSDQEPTDSDDYNYTDSEEEDADSQSDEEGGVSGDSDSDEEEEEDFEAARKGKGKRKAPAPGGDKAKAAAQPVKAKAKPAKKKAKRAGGGRPHMEVEYEEEREAQGARGGGSRGSFDF